MSVTSSLGNASVIDSINNAGSARQPLWLYGSSLALMGGNVGIGVSDPSEELEVKASGDCAILINTSTASNDADRIISVPAPLAIAILSS